jgi:hypothetical protein
MARQQLLEGLSGRKGPAGPGPLGDEDRVVGEWVREDLAGLDPCPDAGALAAATELARFLYRSANDAFRAAYLEPDGDGRRWVRAAFCRRDSYPDEAAVEGTLERIRDRWPHLRDDLRRKTQPTLFGPRTFDPERVRGYLRRVAHFESLHVPRDDQAWRRRPLQPDGLAAPDLAGDEPAGVDYHQLAGLLLGFYGPGNGFPEAERREALLSHGLGFLLDEAELRHRARGWLEARLDPGQPGSVADRLHQLDERLSTLLGGIEELRHLAGGAWHPARRQRLEGRLARAEARLQRLRRRRLDCLARLRPPLRDVAVMLRGFVRGSVGTLRHRRLERETRLLRRRVESGWSALLSWKGEALPAGCADLGRAVLAHLAGEPGTRRQHGLSAAQRQERDRERAAWLEAGREVLAGVVRLREEADRPENRAAPWPAVLDWLTDVEAAYAFGVAGPGKRRGVAEALGRWHGWALARLLRDS